MDDLDRGGSPRSLGSDRLVRVGDQVILYSPVDMPDWEVRKFRQVLIHLDGGRYRISRKKQQPGGTVRYLLEPWPEDHPDLPFREIHYDLPYVEARDAAESVARRREATYALLAPLTPLMGFLPSAWKRRLHERYGIHPQVATLGSLWVEDLCLAVHLVFLVIQVWTGIFSTRYLVIVVAVLVPDILVRHSSLMEEVMDPPGFYEWLIRLRLK